MTICPSLLESLFSLCCPGVIINSSPFRSLLSVLVWMINCMVTLVILPRKKREIDNGVDNSVSARNPLRNPWQVGVSSTHLTILLKLCFWRLLETFILIN